MLSLKSFLKRVCLTVILWTFSVCCQWLHGNDSHDKDKRTSLIIGEKWHASEKACNENEFLLSQQRWWLILYGLSHCIEQNWLHCPLCSFSAPTFMEQLLNAKHCVRWERYDAWAILGPWSLVMTCQHKAAVPPGERSIGVTWMCQVGSWMW